MSEPEIIEVPCDWMAITVCDYFNDPKFTGIIKDEDGDIVHFKDGDWHRDDGPAVECYSKRAVEVWLLHRSIWWLEGTEYPFDEWIKNVNLSPEEKLLLQITYG